MIIKTVLIGDGNVGKTTLRERYMGQGFRSQYIMTIGADFAVREMKINNNKLADNVIRCQIWDLAGQTNFMKVRELYYMGTHGIILVFDCTRPNSFINIDNWLQEAEKNIGTNVPIVLIANKKDLRDSVPNSISKEEGEKMAKKIAEKYFNNKIKVPYIETSAKTGENVDEVFKEVTQLIIENLT